MPTDVVGTDQIAARDLPRRGSTLVSSPAGRDKTMLAAEVLVPGATNFKEASAFIPAE